MVSGGFYEDVGHSCFVLYVFDVSSAGESATSQKDPKGGSDEITSTWNIQLPNWIGRVIQVALCLDEVSIDLHLDLSENG